MATNQELMHQYVTGEPAKDSGKEAAAAMDAAPKSTRTGNAKVSEADLAAHDKRFHHGHYDGGKCEFRTKHGIATTAGKNRVVKLASADKPTPKATTVQGEGIGIFYRDANAKGERKEMKIGDRVRSRQALGEYEIVGADGKGGINLMEADHYGDEGRAAQTFGTDGSDLYLVRETSVVPKKANENAQDYLDAVAKDKKKSDKKDGDAKKDKAAKIKALQDLHDEYNKWFETSDKSDASAWLKEDDKRTKQLKDALEGLEIGKDIQWDADKRNWYALGENGEPKKDGGKDGGKKEELVLEPDDFLNRNSSSDATYKSGKYKGYEVTVCDLGDGRFTGYIEFPSMHPLSNFDFDERDGSLVDDVADKTIPGGITATGTGRFGWDYEHGGQEDFAKLSKEDKEARIAEDAKKVIDAIDSKTKDILTTAIKRKETPEFVKFIEDEAHQQAFEDETEFFATSTIQPYSDEYIEWCYNYLFGDAPLIDPELLGDKGK